MVRGRPQPGSTRTPPCQTSLGLQGEAQWQAQGSPLRSGLHAGSRSGLSANLLRDDAAHFTPRPLRPLPHPATCTCTGGTSSPPTCRGSYLRMRWSTVTCLPATTRHAVRDNRPRVCRIEKPVYGMAQAGRRWQRTIFPWLHSQGLTAMPPRLMRLPPHVSLARLPMAHAMSSSSSAYTSTTYSVWLATRTVIQRTTSSPRHCRSIGTLRTRDRSPTC